MIDSNIDEFSLDWIRTDHKEKLSDVHPEADAFQKICGNILSDPVYKEASGLNLTLLSFPTQGKDGAIDHYAFTDNEETTIVECKKNNSVKNALEEIRKLKDKLSRNLNTKNAINTIYKPWFNIRLKRYIFCTSCQPSSAAEYEELITTVKEMMHHISTIAANLYHINSLEIQVYSWPQLKSWMERSAFLMYKWVQPDIEGVEYVSKKTPYGEGYRSYLSSNKIPYISRDSYINKHPEINDLPSEKKYLDELINNTETSHKGIIIYGEGGIGKTRLMRELALKAEKSKWQSYKVNALADFKELVSLLNPGGKYLLLFDYIEELPEFNDWIENLTQKERTYEVKIIANCRSSYISNVRILTSSQFIKLDISNSTESSRSYYRYVVNEIIRGIPALRDINNKIFKYRPSFAVFVKYLYDKDKSHEFDLRQDEDFRTWIMRRLGLSFSKLVDIKPDKELLTILFTCLPTHGIGKEFLENEYTSEINVLISDGWFENRTEFKIAEQKQFSVIHDTLTDEVLLEYLEQNKQMTDVVVRKFFDFAAKNHLIYGCSRSFERIVDSPLLSAVNFVSVYSRIIESYPEQMKGFYYHLIKTQLISEEAMIPLYFKHRHFFDSYIKSVDFAGPLSYLLNDFSKKELKEETSKQINELYNWWYLTNEKSILSNPHASKIISTSIKFFGANPREQKDLEAYLRASPLQNEASFVIGAWLEAGGHIKIVQSNIINWLNTHEKNFEASFVMGRWLEAGGDIKIVQSNIIKWLKLHEKSFDASFVIGRWLKAGGNIKIVQSNIIKWLNTHEKSFEACFVLGRWLEAGGDIKIVQSNIINWLNIHEKSFEAQFVYSTWLETGGDVKIIAQNINNWLRIHEKSIEASFVIGAWLEAGGDMKIIQTNIVKWLNIHEESFDARFLIGKWLEVGGDMKIIQTNITKWLNIHEKSIEARLVIEKWLEAGGDMKIIQTNIVKWLNIHEKSIEASFVIDIWLKAGGNHKIIQTNITKWLNIHEKLFEASFVIGAWLETGGALKILEDYILNWLNSHAANSTASHILQPWLKFGGKPELIEKPFSAWLKNHGLLQNSYFSLGLWLQKKGNLNTVRFYIAEYVEKFMGTLNADRLLDAWIEAGGEVPFNES